MGTWSSLPAEIYVRMKTNYPEMDIHENFGKWVKNVDYDATMMEVDGRYCAVLVHLDCTELVPDAYVGPPIHFDSIELQKMIDQGINGLYYNPHPVDEILKNAKTNQEKN